MRIRYASLLFCFVFVGCANPYADFYKGIPNARISPDYIPCDEPVRVIPTSDIKGDTKLLIKKGYRAIGESAFHAPSNSGSEQQAIEQARRIGAHVVLVSAKYTHTVSGVMPITTPNTTTSYSNGTVNGYGARGPVTGYYSGTTTTYGTTTSYVPYSIDRSDFDALFFIKSKVRLGLLVETPDDETRRKLNSNVGVVVAVVVEKSPAFNADILPGDIVVSFDDNRLATPDQYYELLDRCSAGAAVNLSLIRNGQPITKTVEPNR